MLRFDSNDPFPLSPYGSTYSETQAHAREADRWLGFRCEQIEAALTSRYDPPGGAQAWIGLGVDALQTPYVELRQLLELLKPAPGQRVVDLGAGYGRLGFVIARHFPGVEFIGFELVAERVNEGNRVLREHEIPPETSRLIQVDLSRPDFAMPVAEIYFIYDFGSRDAIAKSLDDLRGIARRRTITVAGRARAVRDAIEREQPWLSQIVSPEHHGNFSIYKSG